MVTPLVSVNRRGENRLSNNAKYTPVGTSIVSPLDSISPIDTRMTPIRKSLFQRRRITSSKRRKDSFIPHVEDDSRDDSSEIAGLKSANKKKDGHLKILHERFTHIQKGLGSIDEERNQLVEKAKRLDKEKKLIQKQLELREREILTLIKRCASQEEKMRESSKLRATNRELHKQLDLMASKVRVIEEETQDRENLQKLLQDSELEREQLRDRLAKVQREHDAIADTLQECLGNIRRLTEEKSAIEEERRKERKRAEIELEKQQLAHVNNSNILKQSIQEHQNRILQMENILQDKIKSNTDLRREKAVMSQGQHEEIKEVVEKYEQQLQELRHEIDETVERGNQNNRLQNFENVNLMKEKLKSKDEQIQELEKEFSDQMVTLMSKQSSLDESEEEKRQMELKVEAAEKLEVKHAALLDFVEILDSNLAELTTANAHLELEKDELREETEELRRKANMLQRQCSSLQNNQKAKESDFRELLNAENDEIRTELQESLRKSQSEIVSLQAELENGNQRITKLENDLNQARKLIADKEDEIVRIVKQMESLRSNLGADLRKARLQAAQFEAEVYAKNQTLASLEGRLEGAKAIHEASKEVSNSSIFSTQNRQIEASPLENEIRSLREQLQSTETDSKTTRTELEKTIQDVRNEVMFLQQKLECLSEQKATIEKEVEASRGLINDRDEQIVEVQHLVLKHKKRALDLERKLQDTTKELEDHRETLRTLQNDKEEDDLDVIQEPSNNYAELEERIRDLENELSEAKSSQSESIANLLGAHKRIEKLEKQLIGEDARELSLENQLRNATNNLFEEKANACNLENEYHVSTLLQTEHESYNEEARSRISSLEGKIMELKKESNDLGIQVQESRRENADKDEIISSLKVDLVDGQEATKELRSELQIKCTEVGHLELELSKKNKDFEMQIDTTTASLKSKEDRILELEKLVSINDKTVKSLQDSLSKAKVEIARLEDRISCEKDARMIMEEKLREAVANDHSVEATDEDFLPSSNTTALKQKIQVLLTRQADLTTKLDKTSATLALERKSWSDKDQNWYKELSLSKAKLLVLQNVLIERERVISSLQEGENQDSTTEKRLLDQENVISNLKEELRSKAKKIDDLKREFMNKKEDGIQYAFVESDKRRLQVEDELAFAHENIQGLTVNAKVNGQRLKEIEEELAGKKEEVAKKSKAIFKAERRWKVLEEKVQSLDGERRRETENFLKLKKQLKSMKTEIKEQQKTIENFNESTLSLKEATEKAYDEVNHKNDIVASLTKSADKLKLDLDNAESDIASKDDKIRELENALKAEKASRLKLEGDIAATREHASESQKVKEALTKELEEKKLGESKVEENVSEARKALEELNHSSSEHISKLQSQISKMKEDLTRKDMEIRDLRFAELASKKKADHASEKESFMSQIEALKLEVRSLSLKNKHDKEQHDTDTNSLRNEIESLQSAKLELKSKREQLVVLSEGINKRDATIEELKEALLQGEIGEAEISKQRDALQKAELEVRDQIKEMKAEYEDATARENELMSIKLRNKDSLHKEELGNAQSELESTLKKLQDSERLLAERGCRLGEMVDHNREIELELERERTKLRIVEDKFFKEQSTLETTTADLKKLQVELRRKESVLESKLKEERNQKEYAEESLRIAKNKYKEAMKTRRNVTELERENRELKDKICRQEAYLQRKLQKEKKDRARLTPGKSSVSPNTRVLRTPSRQTIAQKSTNSPSKGVPLSSTSSRSRFQAPSTIGRGISTSIPSVRKSTSKISPTAASCRSARTTRSVFSRSTQFQTPSKQVSTLSAQDILQSELDDDRSASSALSSILRTPNAKSSSDAKVEDWELEPRE